MMKKGIIIMAIFSFLAGILGCNPDEPINDSSYTGGRIDNTDHNAPREIKSKDLVGVDMYFFLEDGYALDQDNYFEFKIKKNEKGEFVLTERNREGFSLIVSDEVLKETQKLIEKHELAKNNGYDNTGVALPPEYGPCKFEAYYASGERIFYRADNNPYIAQWASDFKNYFMGVFKEAGFEVQLPTEAFELKDFRLEFSRKDVVYEFNAYNDKASIMGTKFYTDGSNKLLVNKETEWNEDLFAGLKEIIDKYDLENLKDEVDGSIFSDGEEVPDFANVLIVYKNDRRVDLNWQFPPENWLEIREELYSYLEEAFGGF
ncbi:MAG: hypothetical protein GX219_04585 [Tissierellia bacterium]|nr:hypothetical protein [Tissierellia bacterium]NLP47308.1 hypothetical protein [Candidatus Epulonipiscium sp.]